MNYIYVYTNKLNNHQYVGQTNDLARRQREHLSCSFNPESTSYNHLFHKKIREYGIENFEFSVLETVSTIEEANFAEQKWIETLKTYAGDNLGGYNMDRGGQNYVSYIYKDNITNIKNDIKMGLPYEQISKKYGISAGQISNINSGKQYFDEKEKYPLYQYGKTAEEISKVIDLLLNSSKTMKIIAEETSMSYSTIKKINSGALHYNDKYTYPLRKDVRAQRADKVIKMLQQGKSNSEIIKETGMSASSIDRINKGVSYYNNNLSYPLREHL